MCGAGSARNKQDSGDCREGEPAGSLPLRQRKGAGNMKRIAVITGASSGMGRRFAETVDTFGRFDEVWVIARHEAALEGLLFWFLFFVCFFFFFFYCFLSSVGFFFSSIQVFYGFVNDV